MLTATPARALLTSLVLGALVSASMSVHAQDAEPDPVAAEVEGPGPFVGAALIRGTDIESFGVRVEYYRSGTFRSIAGLQDLFPSLMIGADVSYFFPRTVQSGFGPDYTVNFFSLNVNTRADYLEREQISAYWLFGVNVFVSSVSDEAGDVALVYSNAFNAGANLGTGVEYSRGNLQVFGEVKYALSSIDQLVPAVGVRLRR